MKQRSPHSAHTSSQHHNTNSNMEPRIAHVEASIDFMQREISEIKSDIRDIRLELKSETTYIRNDMNIFREELKKEIDSSRQELKLEMASTRADFRILLSAIIAATLSLGGMIAKSSGWL